MMNLHNIILKPFSSTIKPNLAYETNEQSRVIILELTPQRIFRIDAQSFHKTSKCYYMQVIQDGLSMIKLKVTVTISFFFKDLFANPVNNTEIGLDVMHCFSLCRYLLRQLHNIFCFNTLKLYFSTYFNSTTHYIDNKHLNKNL
jgi:hypothetical protein